jgi:hypothetical protein
VLTLQSGTVSELQDLRGTGPFRDYEVPPEEMLDLAAQVVRTQVSAVAVARDGLRVVGKERAGADAARDEYNRPWRSAVVVFVHRVPGRPGACRVEVHATHRGPFHRGRIAWERDLPGMLDDAVAHRGRTPVRPL